MALKSFNDYLKYTDLERLQLEMAAGVVSKVPIAYDDDDLAFLVDTLPLKFWTQGIHWRYNTGLLGEVKKRNLNAIEINYRGKWIFPVLKNANMDDLIDKLGGAPDYDAVSHDEPDSESARDQRRQYAQGKKPDGSRNHLYDYDLTKVYDQTEGPMDMFEGMPVMQESVASASISSWIKAQSLEIIGAHRDEWQGEPTTMRVVKPYNVEVPCVLRHHYCVFIGKNGRPQTYNKPDWMPILNSGKYVPIPDWKSESILDQKKKGGGLNAYWLMNNAGKMSPEELEHFKNEMFGPEDILGGDTRVAHSRFYVVGGWSPNNQQQGEHAFTNEDLKGKTIDDVLREKFDGKSVAEGLQEEAKAGFDKWNTAESSVTPEGVVLQLMRGNVEEAALQKLIQNLKNPKLKPYEETDDGSPKFDLTINRKARITKAYNFVKNIAQTNVSLVNGTRRLREKRKLAGQEGLPSQEELAQFSSRRKFVDVTDGVEAGSGWIGHSLRTMQRNQMAKLDSDAHQKAERSSELKNVEAQVRMQSSAVAHLLDKLIMKYASIQASHVSLRGAAEAQNISIDMDSALGAAVEVLPKAMKKFNMNPDDLPADVQQYFLKLKNKFKYDAGQGEENPGVKLLNDLLGGKTVSIGGKEVNIQSMATDETVLQGIDSMIDNFEEMSTGRDRTAMGNAMGQLIVKINQIRHGQGLSQIGANLQRAAMPAIKEPESASEFQSVQSVASFMQYMSNPVNLVQLKTQPQLRSQFAQRVSQLVQSGSLDKSNQERAMQILNQLGGVNEMSLSTGDIASYSASDSQMWGAPGGLGDKSPSEEPIKKGRKKGKKKKK